MAGAYVSKPPVYQDIDFPPGWNINWPFMLPPEFGTLPVGSSSDLEVGPIPPGYEPQYSLVMSAQ